MQAVSYAGSFDDEPDEEMMVDEAADGTQIAGAAELLDSSDEEPAAETSASTSPPD